MWYFVQASPGRRSAAGLMVALACATASPAPGGPAARPFDPTAAHGIYVIGGTRQTSQWTRLLGIHGIAGVALSEPWDEVEPSEGRYEWSDLDARIAVAAEAGKTVSLRILPGISTPAWVYQKGAAAFSFVDRNPYHSDEFYARGHRHQTFGKSLTIPVPWDETFLASWERFVAALGAHFQDPTRVAMVHVLGPNRHSAEMILPHEEEDRRRWLALGYKPEKLVGAWKRCIDAFARAFPGKPLVLNLSPTIFRDGVAEEVARYGYERYGQRFFMQNNILLADNRGMQREDWGIMKRYAARTTIGFQRQLLRLKARRDVREEDRLHTRRENFEGMFREGLALGAKYFEVGDGEVRDFPDVVEQVAARLKR